MKSRFWLFQRQGIYYVEDTLTRRQESLGTRERREVERLRNAKNEAVRQPVLGLAQGRAYLAAHDPRMVERTWDEVMADFQWRGQTHAHRRRQRGMRSAPLRLLHRRKLFKTTADDLLVVIHGSIR